jgi:dihydroxyacetone kinase-like predicted kinase
MKVCLKLPVRNLLITPSDSVLSVVSNLAADVLLNGQGNSGTILSHFFVSLAEEIKDSGHTESLTIDKLAQCITRTGVKMQDAVPDPVEGTMVSVARDCCNLSEEGPFATLKDLLNAWTAKAKAELAKTPEALVVNGVRVLEKAGVVDSGAQGFVYIIEGMHLASRNELPEASDINLFKMASIEADEGVGADVHVDHTVTDTEYQFCTEAVVLLKDGIDKKSVVDSVTKFAAEETIGDSIACVGAPAKQGGNMIKLHIHSNEPEKVFAHLRQFSREPILRKEKVEDMREMRQLYHEDSAVDLANAKFSIVGMCDIVLPPMLRDSELQTLPVFVVPSDTQEPIDIRFANSNDTCAALNRQRHADTAIRYTTAASNPMQIKIEILAALAKRQPVLVVLFSTDKRVSALGRNALAAIEMLTKEQQSMVKVFVHGWFMSEVLFLRKAIQFAQEEKSIEEAIDAVTHMADRTCCFAGFSCSETVRKLVVWRPGLFPKDFASSIEDGHYYTLGVEPKIREGPVLSDMQRAGLLMNLLGEAPDYDTAQDDFIERIKGGLKPGQRLEQVMIQCSGRPDIGHAFVKKMKKAGIPLEDEPLVYSAGFMSVAMTAFGEMNVIYNIIQ